ncbi:CAP domain-containing protein [Streptomyces sp. KM273126]|uniref:CAP domain-containing protein n=1 Tax=Streptomyces sp. KM273126 TaxID=2545247 RepID=UPI00103E3FA9|nr:CAP domain-containing protein [Streptomyces sp. KM273126]MBA2809250.1 CAP domain-containing protein [Streptomyces sp. KM273126]
MGRHRRSAAGRAARGRATGVTHTEDAITERYGPENLYGFAAVLETETPHGRRSHRKQKSVVTPVKTGLLGVSAAVAIGTAAVAAGVLPGGDKYAVSGGGSADTVTPAGTPTSFETQQGGTDGPANRAEESTSRDSQREAASPSPPPSETATQPKTPSKKPSSKAPKPEKPEKTKEPAGKATEKPEKQAPVKVSAETKAEAEVLRLVNEERQKAGCSPVSANSALSDLASAFSQDMAKRGFFEHTDPDGKSPWDRATALGITDLGAENIARGQATAAAVMEAWMNSPGHRANILNCDFKTLGVGVNLGSGGPWWTQDFGY